MSSLQAWRGVRLATFEAGADPDAEPHRVAIPTGWGARAASGFAALACAEPQAGWDKTRLPEAAERWIGPLDAASRAAGGAGDLGATLHALLLLRQACPDRGVWRRTGGGARFALNLAGFADPDTGLDEPCLDSAVDAIGAALVLLACDDDRALRIAGLDGMLAAFGLDYDSAEARALAARLLRRVRTRLAGIDPSILLVAAEAGPAEALLGVETAGFAPAFSPVNEEGRLTVAAEARLAHRRLSPERALAMALEGDMPMAPAGPLAHAAMHDALAPLLDRAPARPALPRPRIAAETTRPESGAPGSGAGAPRRRPMPARSKGFTQRVTVGGQRLFLRTGEFEDGSLGEVSIALQGREAGRNGLAEALSTAVSVALQHGVPLAAFVDAFAHGRFGAGGTVEGDPAILAASSPLDYAFRALAEAYLGRHIPDPAIVAEPPKLPLELPGAAPPRQRSLRLVSGA